jgi:hypothetical protein
MVPSASGAAQLTQHVSRVVGDAMLFEQRDEFLLKRHLSVMRRLIPDIANDRNDVRFAHAEQAKSSLPRN